MPQMRGASGTTGFHYAGASVVGVQNDIVVGVGKIKTRPPRGASEFVLTGEQLATATYATVNPCRFAVGVFANVRRLRALVAANFKLFWG